MIDWEAHLLSEINEVLGPCSMRQPISAFSFYQRVDPVNGVALVDLWKRMSKQEGRNSKFHAHLESDARRLVTSDIWDQPPNTH